MTFQNKIKVGFSALFIMLGFYFMSINLYNNYHPITSWVKYTWTPILWSILNMITMFFIGGYLFRIYIRLSKLQIDMDTLIGLAAHILFLYSLVNTIINYKSGFFKYEVFWEASILLICFAFIGRTLEAKLRKQSVDGYKELLKLRKKEAILFKNNKEEVVPVNEIKIGDLIVIKKGEIIPLDGVLVTEKGIINNSNITGESKLQVAFKNNEIISGSLNEGDKILIKVTKLFSESTISVIIDKAEDLSMIKPKIQKFADKILKFFLPGVFSIAIFSFFFWLTLGYTTNFSLPWIKTSTPLELGVLSMVTILAIACPCALGIATPLIITISAVEANKNSLLFSDINAFEKINDIGFVAFDKTGTLTTGKMNVVRFDGDDKYKEIASAIESHSHHPIATAISTETTTKLKANDVEEIHGLGIKGKVNNIEYKLLKSMKQPKVKGSTAIEMFEDDKLIAEIELIDDIKPNAEKLIKWLHKRKIKVAMITGDAQPSAKRVAEKLNIEEYFFDVKPEEKQNKIKKIKKMTNKQVVFVGDGFNDILAIQEADISMSFSSGSDITNSLADISILNNDLLMIAKAIKLSSLTKRSVVSTLCWAFIFNAIAIPIAFIMLVLPWVAALIMLGSDLGVVINAFIFRARSKKKLRNIK